MRAVHLAFTIPRQSRHLVSLPSGSSTDIKPVLEDFTVKLNRFPLLAAALAAASLALTACGGSSSPSADAGSTSSSTTKAAGLAGSLNGAGSTAQQAAMAAWQAAFQTTNPDVTINYDPVGSGGGREQFLAGGAILFAGSDAALTADELTTSNTRCAGGTGAIDLPVYVSPIAIAYNLPAVASLQLSPDTIAKIFAGKITKWDDAALKADNPGVKLPSTAITPVHRADDSGTTQNFTEYLSKAAPSSWTFPAAQTWPVKGGEAAQGTSGVVQSITQGKGAIGYADASQVGKLGVAKVKVGSTYVAESADAAAKVAELSKATPGRPAGDLSIDVARDTTEAGAYPVILISYQIVCRQYAKASDGDLVKAFETYVTSAEGQAAAAKAAGSAPLSDALRTKVQASIALIKGSS
jgi:phosphate transport system substrate-binding protein